MENRVVVSRLAQTLETVLNKPVNPNDIHEKTDLFMEFGVDSLTVVMSKGLRQRLDFVTAECYRASPGNSWEE